MEQVVEAVAALRYRDHDIGLFRPADQSPFERISLSDQRKSLAKRIEAGRKSLARALELDSHEKTVLLEIGILLAVENEAVMLGQKSGHGGHQADPVFCGEGKNIVFCHMDIAFSAPNWPKVENFKSGIYPCAEVCSD